jgi:AraC-like DNA-binding protein
MPGSEHVIAFHIMLDGACWAQVADESESPVRMTAGDAVIFPHGEAHFMAPELGQRAKPDLEMYYRPIDQALPFVIREFGGDGEAARFVCGYLGCDARPFNPVLDALPRMMHVRASSTGGVMTIAERFSEIMGVPPMQYLANWRLQRAARLLERPNISIAQAAAAVGYESEAAFNRAFKKQVGLPPGAWRRSRAPALAKAAPA